MSETSTIIVRVPQPTKEELQIIAIKKHTNMNAIVSKLIKDFVDANK